MYWSVVMTARAISFFLIYSIVVSVICGEVTRVQVLLLCLQGRVTPKLWNVTK